MFKAIVGMLVRKGRTKRGEGVWYGARLVPSRISHQIFFQDLNFPHDFNFATRRQLFFTTSTFFHDFNFPARLQLFFPRIQLSRTTSTFLHDFNFFHDFQFFHNFNFFYDFNTSTFQHDLNIPMSRWIWTP